MRFHLERTGGFAGRRLQIDLDSESLPAAEARELDRLLARSHFFELPIELKSSAPGADRFQFRLTIERQGQAHTVLANEAAMPVELRPLLDFLTHHHW